MLAQCVICYDHLKTSEPVCHTSCGHVFHQACLTQWFEGSKTCPECRQNEPETKIQRLLLNFVSDPDVIEAAIVSNFQKQISGLNQKLLIKECEIIESNSNNKRLEALVNSKEQEISALQIKVSNAQEATRLWKNRTDEQNREIEEKNKIIAQLAEERDDVLCSNHSWEQLSQMFQGETDPDTLVDMISTMKSKLETNTSYESELQRSVILLQHELGDTQDVLIAERKHRCNRDMEFRTLQSNLTSLRSAKMDLERRVQELEAMVDIGEQPIECEDRQPVVRRYPMTAYNSVRFKKRKVDTSDVDSSSTTTIDVIDLTEESVQPMIDLTNDCLPTTAYRKSSICAVPIPTFKRFSTSLDS